MSLTLQINAVKPLISLDTAIIQMDIGKVSNKQLETIVASFGKPGAYEVKRVTKKRSLSANAYCWVLCDAIAEKLGTTKEAVYRQAVGDVGVCYPLGFIDTEKGTAAEQMASFKRMWHSNGIGWLTKTIDENTLLAYKGSSAYDQKEMNRLLDWLVDAAQQQGVPTMSDDELRLMIGRWKE